MCTSFDKLINQCSSCANGYVLVDFEYIDQDSNLLNTTKVCALVEEHQFCEFDLLTLNTTREIEVNYNISVLLHVIAVVISKQVLMKFPKNRYVLSYQSTQRIA